MIPAGTEVRVARPVKDYQDQWLLPGEAIYVITEPYGSDPRGQSRHRVRCPASGADMWIPEADLVPVDSDLDVRRVVREEVARIAESALWQEEGDIAQTLALLRNAARSNP